MGVNPYYLDLSAVSLQEFSDTITADNLSPGRVILLEEKDERFTKLGSLGITTLEELVGAVKTPRSVDRLAATSGIPAEYLTILRRQALSWKPKPVALNRFEAPKKLVDALAGIGIASGYDLYTVAAALQGGSSLGRFAPTTIEALAHQASVESAAAELARLATMADLTRIPGIGPVFAAIFVDIGVDSCEALSQSEASTLHEEVLAAAERVGYRGPSVTKWDVEFCIDFARRLMGR